MRHRTLVAVLFASTSPAAIAAPTEFSTEIYIASVLYADDDDGDAAERLHDALGIYNVHESGQPFRRGFNLQRAQIAITAKRAGWGSSRISFTADSHRAYVDEAWLQSERFASGLQLRVGEFYSAIGADNEKRLPDWDFVDRPLPYQMLLGGDLRGTGLQLNWFAWDRIGLRVGAEALQTRNVGVAAHVGSAINDAGQPIAFDARPAWPAVWTSFVKLDAPLAGRQRLRAGASWIHSASHQELHDYHPGINDANHGLQGRASMWGVDLGYRRDGSSDGTGELDLQAEYWRQHKDLYLSYHQLKPVLVGQPRDLLVDGAYVQARYRPAANWQFAVRYDIVGMTHRASRAAATVGPTTISQFDDMNRYSIALTWSATRNQRLRLQLDHARAGVPLDINGDGKDDPVRKGFNQLTLQYLLAFDAR